MFTANYPEDARVLRNKANSEQSENFPVGQELKPFTKLYILNKPRHKTQAAPKIPMAAGLEVLVSPLLMRASGE